VAGRGLEGLKRVQRRQAAGQGRPEFMSKTRAG
jgi:hypothetical protein